MAKSSKNMFGDEYKKFFETELKNEDDLWEAFKSRKERKQQKQADKHKKDIWKAIGASKLNRSSSSLVNQVKKVLKVKRDVSISVIVYCIENGILTKYASRELIQDAYGDMKRANLRFTRKQFVQALKLIRSHDSLIQLLIPGSVIKKGTELVSKRKILSVHEARNLIQFIYQYGLSKLTIEDMIKALNKSKDFSIDSEKTEGLKMTRESFKLFYDDMRKVDKNFGLFKVPSKDLEKLKNIGTTLFDDELKYIIEFVLFNGLINVDADFIYSRMKKDKTFKEFDKLSKYKKEVLLVIDELKKRYQKQKVSAQGKKIERRKRSKTVDSASKIKSDFESGNTQEVNTDAYRNELIDLSKKSSKFLNDLGDDDIVEFALANPDKIVQYAESVIDAVKNLGDDDAPGQSIAGLELVKLKEHREHLINVGDIEGAKKIDVEIKERSQDTNTGVERLSKIQERIRDIMQETLELQRAQVSKQDIGIDEIKEKEEQKETEEPEPETPKEIEKEKSKFGFLFKLLFGAIGLTAFAYFAGLFKDGNFQKLMDGIKTGNWKQVTEVLGGLELMKGLIGTMGIAGGYVLLKTAMIGYKTLRLGYKTLQLGVKGLKSGYRGIVSTVNFLKNSWNSAKNAIEWAKGMASKVTGTVKNLGKKAAKGGKAAATVAKDVAKSAKGAKILKTLTRFAKFIPGLGTAIAAGAAIYAGVDGWMNADEYLGIEKSKLSWVHRAASAGGSIVNDVTFGLVKTDKTASLILTAAKKMGFDPNTEPDDLEGDISKESEYDEIFQEVINGQEIIKMGKNSNSLNALKGVQQQQIENQNQSVHQTVIQPVLNASEDGESELSAIFEDDIAHSGSSNRIHAHNNKF